MLSSVLFWLLDCCYYVMAEYFQQSLRWGTFELCATRQLLRSTVLSLVPVSAAYANRQTF